MPSSQPANQHLALVDNCAPQGCALRFQLRSHLAYVAEIRGLVAACAELMHYPASRRMAILQVLSEALNNAILHAHQGEQESWIQVELEFQPNLCDMAIADQGEAYALDEAALPAPDASSGRGIYIMRELCEKLELTREAGGNMLRLRVR